ncbi:hypothetical protein J1N35_037456 [Gossypium stocksii]|uniref:Uncharacterized protein n=1 Tax=Gossypium stocksii TaxID=47602 RepID=A0A9D3UK55_9ROSI|nr:hypothetical protein J1N35_037456 [Gossypium stocksii]
MSQSDYSYSSLPKEIALKIASSLEVVVLEIGKNYAGRIVYESRFLKKDGLFYTKLIKTLTSREKEGKWREGKNGEERKIWRERKDWRGFYVKQHEEEKRQAESVINLVEQLKAVDYLHAISCLEMVQFGFRDVQMLLLKPKLNVLLNLIGLHYCLNNLQVSAFHITEAIWSGKIADRQVCVKWRPPYNFRNRGGDQSRCVCLKDLVKGEDDGEVLTVLERGATYELSRVQVSDPFSGSDVGLEEIS